VANKEIKALVRLAQERGWSVTDTRNGHLKFQSPDGDIVFGPSTPSDWRSVKNMKAHLRRAGLPIPHKGG
jgi:hypothetical protein